MEQLVEHLKLFFISLENPILQAFVGGLFTWGLTAIGASLVFFFKSSNTIFGGHTPPSFVLPLSMIHIIPLVSISML